MCLAASLLAYSLDRHSAHTLHLTLEVTRVFGCRHISDEDWENLLDVGPHNYHPKCRKADVNEDGTVGSF